MDGVAYKKAKSFWSAGWYGNCCLGWAATARAEYSRPTTFSFKGIGVCLNKCCQLTIGLNDSIKDVKFSSNHDLPGFLSYKWSERLRVSCFHHFLITCLSEFWSNPCFTHNITDSCFSPNKYWEVSLSHISSFLRAIPFFLSLASEWRYFVKYSQIDPDEARRILAREKKASAENFSNTLKRHTLILKKRDLMRRKAEEEKKMTISQLLAAEGLELDSDSDEAL